MSIWRHWFGESIWLFLVCSELDAGEKIGTPALVDHVLTVLGGWLQGFRFGFLGYLLPRLWVGVLVWPLSICIISLPRRRCHWAVRSHWLIITIPSLPLLYTRGKQSSETVNNVSKAVQLLTPAKFRPINVGPIFNYVTSCKDHRIILMLSCLLEIVGTQKFGNTSLEIVFTTCSFLNPSLKACLDGFSFWKQTFFQVKTGE